MEIKRIEGEIEAILFAMGEAVELSRIAKAIQQDMTITENIIRNMMIRYQEEDRGIQIIELENSFQLCTKKEYYDSLIRIAAQPKKPTLTDVMLETLSIIAYKQPVTKAEIEKIKNVFLAILRDIKKEMDSGEQPGETITAAMFQTMQEAMKNHQQEPLSMDDVTAMIAGRVGQLLPMDEETAEQFRQLAKRMMEQVGK